MPGSTSQRSSDRTLRVIGQNNRKQFDRVWVDALAASGQQDENLFFDGSQLLNDVQIQVLIRAVALKNDGTEGYSCQKVASFRKDGAADAVQVGVTSTVHEHRDDAGASVTMSIQPGNFVRVSYTSGGIDVYRWTVFATITQTLL